MKDKEEIKIEDKVEQSQEAQQASEDVIAQVPYIEKPNNNSSSGACAFSI